MTNDVHVIESLAAHALGSLDGEEAVQVAEHLATCPGCSAELLTYEAVVGGLALAAPDVPPPAGLKQKVLGSLMTPGVEPVAATGRSVRERFSGLFHGMAPAWRIVGLVVVILSVASNLWWFQRVNRDRPMVTPGGMQVVALAGTDAAPDAVGTLVISEDGEYGTLVVDRLPALDQDHQYQLWLIHDGHRTSGGIFSVNPEGYGALWVSSPESLSSYSAFGITIEPSGGSAGPTGDRVLGSSS